MFASPSGCRPPPASFFSAEGRAWVIRQEGDLRGFGCREGFRSPRAGSGGTEVAKDPFGPTWSGIAVARQRRHYQRVPLLRCNRGRAPNAPAICFLRIAASILPARKLARYDGGKRVPATVSAIADAIRGGRADRHGN